MAVAFDKQFDLDHTGLHHASNTSDETGRYRSQAQVVRTAATVLNDFGTWIRPATSRRRLAPKLEERVRRLEAQKRQQEAESYQKQIIGRIPEQQLAELDGLRREHEGRVFRVRRQDKPWTGGRDGVMPQGGVRLSGGPVLTDNEASMLESDVSSVIDISDHLAASDTEDDAHRDELYDQRKYCLPDIGKTRLHLMTKEPLSPKAPRVIQNNSSRPSTPQTAHSSTNSQSPGMMEFPSNWHTRNYGIENPGDSEPVRPSLSRAGSVYTLGRATFTGQLAQLTSMRLPDAESLAKKISSMPSAAEAAKALSDASEQIRMWISKASEVLNGLNSEDDVEWAAAGGREGIEDVDLAIGRFQHLVEVYILSLERLQTRADISQLSAVEMKGSVGQMDNVISSWKNIKDTLRGVKEQVEIAMEWEVLWNTVLGEVAQEMEGLNQLVFEMEEKRHQGAESLLTSKDSIDLSELETIIEEQPGRGKLVSNSHLSLPSFSPASRIPMPPQAAENKEDSSLLALFARMEPLRASLDFLPMRISAWHIRGNLIFPSACADLEHRRDQLESQWNKLESDAESLRRELGEDRWVIVFRNAGRQALKMCESITRSFLKLKEGIDAGEEHLNPDTTVTKIQNYEQKKRHYGPAIGRVLAIIDRGVQDRLTVNGEVLRLQSDMQRRWTALQSEMADMDAVIEEINVSRKEKNLRDSVSTVISSERSIASSLLDTPGSSPASSVVGGSRKGSFGSRTPTPLTNIKTRSSSSGPRNRLSSGSSLPRGNMLLRPDIRSSPRSPPSSIPMPSKQPAWPSRPEPDLSNKPRFHNVAKIATRDFRPLAAFEPSPYAKTPVTPKTNYLRSTSKADDLPGMRTPVPRIASTPLPSSTSSLSRPITVLNTSRKSSLPVPTLPSVPSVTPSRPSRLSLHTKASAPTLRPTTRISSSGRRSSMLPAPPTDGNEADSESPSHHRTRPPSAQASGRRSGLAHGRPRSRLAESTSSAAAAAPPESRPKWRP